VKVNGLTNLKYSPYKTTRRNFGMLNNAIRKRLLYRKKLSNFTRKELDAETGLYYYGARYLDPKTSRWLSGDPALGEYLPVAPVNDDARKRNQNLPGQGGVFNYVNLHAYHYAGNNPVKYTDPDGKITQEQHLERNKYQNGYAPPNKEKMDKMVEMGLFVNYGNTITHNNIVLEAPSLTTESLPIPFIGTNTDYRGAVGTIFEGMQFIYDSQGNLVVDSLNKGTFDYISPLKDKQGHARVDLIPWSKWGNGSNDYLRTVIMNEKQWDKIQAIYTKFKLGIIKSKEEAAQEVKKVLPPPPPKPMIKPEIEE